jgi:(p)ppGpp synthase/HD superfamily hydrolase
MEAKEEDAMTTAERLARHAHGGQVDKVGEHYVDGHLTRVAGLVAGDGADAQAVGWLHDVLEDTPLTVADLRDAGVPARVIEAVALLTRPPKGAPDRGSYADYIGALLAADNPLALAVKLADLRDHLNPHCPPRLRPRYELALEVLSRPAVV